MGKTIQGVVLGVGGDVSPAAVDVAAAEAARRRVPLHVCAEASRPAAEAIRRVFITWPDLVVTARAIREDFAETLIDESRTAQVVVVPLDDEGRYARVAAHAYCPTLVTPPGVTGAPGPVLVGMNIAANDEPAVAFAFEEAALRGVPLVAVHVWSGVPRDDLSPVDPYVYHLGTARATADRLLAEALAGWAEKYPDVPVERQPRYGVNPAGVLADASARAGLVVLGANRRARFSGQLLGTVARRVLQRAGCPVAVVRLASG